MRNKKTCNENVEHKCIEQDQAMMLSVREKF